jgi:ribosomal protein L21E
MSGHPFSEGARVSVKVTTTYGPHRTAKRRRGTVEQVSETQPHITWVRWDDDPRRTQIVGTSHLKPVR